MAKSSAQNLIIAKAAKTALKPLGCQQKGNSRIWFDDHGWWLTLIEFQPSAWGKGSYLNVGAMWLWHAQDHWSFHNGYRVEGFQPNQDESQFVIAAGHFAKRAADEVLACRKKFSLLPAVAKYLCGIENKTEWDHYHAAIALALSGAQGRAAVELSAVLQTPVHAPWVEALQDKAKALFTQESCPKLFHKAVYSEIAKARRLLKLPPIDQVPCFEFEGALFFTSPR